MVSSQDEWKSDNYVIKETSSIQTEPQSQQAGTISVTPSTCLTLFDQQDPQRLHLTSLMGPRKLLFHMNDWLMLHNFLNPLKQATAALSEP